MRNPKVGESINRTKEFMQLWMKFHQIYNEAMGKPTITPEEEKAFFDTKSIIARKFQVLADSIKMDRHTIDRTYEVINQILSLKSISTLSEHTLKKIENDWHQSYISLNRLLGHLEASETAGAQGREGGAGVGRSIANSISTIAVIIIFVLVVLFIIYVFGVDILDVIHR